MRQIKKNKSNNTVKVLCVDDDSGVLDSLAFLLGRANFLCTTTTNPLEAIELVKKESFDIMILDFAMPYLNGVEVVEEIRKFNKDLYIVLLTGNIDLLPPIETIKRLNIQGYCEKSNKFEQLLFSVESGRKSVSQINKIQNMNI